jgi:hypothetical protein
MSRRACNAVLAQITPKGEKVLVYTRINPVPDRIVTLKSVNDIRSIVQEMSDRPPSANVEQILLDALIVMNSAFLGAGFFGEIVRASYRGYGGWIGYVDGRTGHHAYANVPHDIYLRACKWFTNHSPKDADFFTLGLEPQQHQGTIWDYFPDHLMVVGPNGLEVSEVLLDEDVLYSRAL